MKFNYKMANAVSACLVAFVGGAAQVNAQQLEEILVTAQKRTQSLQDVPISVSVVTGEDMDRQFITETVSLAQAVPSVNFQEGFAPSSTNFNIRGVASYTFEGGIQPSVAMVVDGVSFARAGEFLTELADIERVEVLRGPQGTLFGRNTTAGAINITTRRPTHELEGYLQASFTDDDEQLYRGRISGALSDTVAASVNGFYQDRDGHIENVYPGGDDGGGIESWGARVQLDVDFSDKVNVLFSGDYRDAEHGFSPQISEIPEASLDGIPAPGLNLREIQQGDGDPVLGRRVMGDIHKVNINDSNNFDQELSSWGVSADLTWELNDELSLKSITAYREWEEAVNPDVDSGPGQLANGGYGLPVSLRNTSVTPSSSLPHSRPFQNEYITQELRLEGSGESLEWIGGIFYTDFEERVRNSLDLYIPFDPEFGEGYTTSSQVDNSSELTAYSVFFDATFHITETVDIYGGYRWTREELDVSYNSPTYFLLDSFGVTEFDLERNVVNVTAPVPPAFATVGSADTENDDWSGRLGLSWAISDDTSLYATASRSFVGLGADLSRTGSPDSAFLDPTSAEAFEVGAKSMLFDHSLQLNAAIFTQDVEDLQTAALLPGTVDTVNLNAGDLDIFGVEVDAVWAVTDIVKLSASVTYLDAEVENLLQPCYPEQTIATGCSLDSNGNQTEDPSAAVQTDVEGTDATNTPELKYNLGINIDIPLNSMPFDLYGSMNYVWQDDVHFSLNDDPLLYQDSYGVLNLALGLVDNEGRYELSLFGRNITDEDFVNDASESSGFIARRYVRVTRGAQAFYGIRLKYNFF